MIFQTNYWLELYHRKIKFTYRYDPVPYTGLRMRGGYCWMRRMQTTQERRHNCKLKQDIQEYPEIRTRPRWVPDSWDDYIRSDTFDRSWKSCTKNRKQWM